MVRLGEYHREYKRVVIIPGHGSSERSGVELRYRTRHEFGRRGARLAGQHAVEDGSGVPGVFGPVGRVDFRVNVVVGVHEGDVLLDGTGPDPTFVSFLDAAEPDPIAPLDGSDVQVIAVGDDPNRDQLSHRAVAPGRRD